MCGNYDSVVIKSIYLSSQHFVNEEYSNLLTLEFFLIKEIISNNNFFGIINYVKSLPNKCKEISKFFHEKSLISRYISMKKL